MYTIKYNPNCNLDCFYTVYVLFRIKKIINTFNTKRRNKMKHTIETEVEVPAGWKPLGFAYIKLGEDYLRDDGNVAKWVWSPKSSGLCLRVQREIWKPRDGDKVWLFDTTHGVCNMLFRSDSQENASLNENNFLFETEAEAREAYNETLTLMKKLKEEK